MTDLSGFQPLERFTGLADTYARFRPDYPAAAIDFILQGCNLVAGSVLVDVGCGTGISTRLFAERGLHVIGIEPNDDMRAQAEAVALPPGTPRPVYQAGQAEATGLPAATADAVLAAQAFHWFQADAALGEFHRILKPGGWVILAWNERDEADPATAAFGAVIRTTPQASVVEGPRRHADRPLLESPLFHDARRDVFPHQQIVDEEGLLGRALSASYAPREPAQVEAFTRELRQVFARFQQDGQVTLRYQTSVTTGTRSSRP
jgi:SAM-dependent methyltransferase